MGVLAEPLLQLINACLTEGVFPECLKVAKTVPIYKRGDPDDISSFRPVSIVPMLGKIIETAMLRQTSEYLEFNNLLGNMQHGFRRGRSTTSAVLSLVERIQGAFEEHGSVDLVLCDLSKAFDCVSHNILLRKLARYGFRGRAWRMLAGYLRDRRQVVSIMGAVSKEENVPHGVPQGSVLGPLLFLLMINDLHLDNSSLLFADDTTIIGQGRGPQLAKSRAQELFTEAEKWFSDNKLKLNVDKTREMICTLGRTDNLNVAPVTLLGFGIDSKLSWEPHIAKVSKKLSRVVYLFRRMRGLLSVERLLMLYHAVFGSHIQYGILVWGHSSHAKDILLLQKRALRVMTYSKFDAHCQPIFQRLGIHTVFGLYILASLLYVRKNISTFLRRGEVHSYSTRGRVNLDVPRRRLSRVKDCFPVLAVRMFNCLPRVVRERSVSVFKTSLSRWLIARSFYRLEDFFNDNFAGL
jgi:hypothetical protein